MSEIQSVTTVHGTHRMYQENVLLAARYPLLRQRA